MSESSGSKTEPPSSRRLREAREKGQVAFSQDMCSALVLVVAIGVIAMSAVDIAEVFLTQTRRCVDAALRPDLSIPTLVVGAQAGLEMALATAPILGSIVVVGLAACFLQVGPLLTVEPLIPKLEKLNPIKGLKNLIFSKRGLVELLKNLLKFIVAGIIGFGMLWSERSEFVRLSLADHVPAAAWVFGFTIRMCFAVVGTFIILSIGDVIYQRWQHNQDLMMTKDEAKRDYKQEEGDPDHKARRKAMQEEIAFGITLQEVPDSDVIITNPDHIAVALRWDGNDEAPRIVCKGKGFQAEKIKITAAKAGVPIRRQESLARALVLLRINAQIPAALYEAVAAILEWAESESELSGRVPNWRKNRDAESDEQPES